MELTFENHSHIAQQEREIDQQTLLFAEVSSDVTVQFPVIGLNEPTIIIIFFIIIRIIMPTGSSVHIYTWPACCKDMKRSPIDME